TARDRGVGAEFDRRTEARDPDVRAVREPVVIADVSEAVASPVASPGVLNPETLSVVRDDGEGMSAGDRGLLAVLDTAAGSGLVPAVVDRAGGVQHTDLGDRRVHRDHVLVIDTQVRAKRTL